MLLNLRNPIIFFDLETTGTDVAVDRIVELTYLKVYPTGKEELKTIRVNPTVPIPRKATEIHGITDDDVKNEPTFAVFAKTIAGVFEGCDIAGYNSNKFDIPLLAEEFLRADVDIDLMKRKFVDIQVIFHKKEQRTLSAAYKFYCDKTLENAHSSEADTRATYEILMAQLDRYADLQNDIDALSKFSSHNRNVDFLGRIVYDDEGNEIFNFGKYKGQSVDDVLKKDPGYYGWMMNGQFPLHTKKVLTAIKLRSAFGKQV
ncbi:MAG: 3'-5' exonuclease [Bacteroidales bacterium]|nr:3'-5' exonuclease [Bacteroidales bacterium]